MSGNGPYALAALGAALGVACAGLLELEPSVPYAPDEAFVFPGCAQATRKLLCQDPPKPVEWAPPDRSDLPDGGDRCSLRVEPGRTGDALSVTTNPAIPVARDVDGWCAFATFAIKAGFRSRVAFRVRATPREQRFGLVAFFLPNTSSLVVEYFEGQLRARPFANGAIIELPDKSQAIVGPFDDQWHELALHVSDEGRMILVFDGKVRSSPVEIGAPGAGLAQIAFLDSARADVEATVLVDNVTALPY